jgi:DNA segregation ATPase FtsK/SpoIIIE-like protein
MGGSGKGISWDARISSGAVRTSSRDARTGKQLRYDETMRVLNRQATVLSELRNRANILLAANAIVATLFGASALGKHHLLALKISALAVFALGIGACVAILWSVHDDGTLVDPAQWPKRMRLPKAEAKENAAAAPTEEEEEEEEEKKKKKKKDIRRWQVTFDPEEVVGYLNSRNIATVSKINEKFAVARKTNWKTIDRRTTFLEAASVLLAVQIILWSCLALA